MTCEAALKQVVSKPSNFGRSWDSSWFLTGCKEKDGAYCRAVVGTCPSGGTHTLETFPIGGIPGQHYKVTFQFNALAEAKQYMGGVYDAGRSPNNPGEIWDSFHRDGTPLPSGYNAWQLSVYDDKGRLGRNYYMNSFPGPGWESNRMFLLSFKKWIVIVGGGKITHLVEDSDCKSVNNCGAGSVPDDVCPEPRRLPGNDANTLLPAQYQDPADGMLKPTLELSPTSQNLEQPWHSQLGHLTVTKVEPTDDPVTMDYK